MTTVIAFCCGGVFHVNSPASVPPWPGSSEVTNAGAGLHRKIEFLDRFNTKHIYATTKSSIPVHAVAPYSHDRLFSRTRGCAGRQRTGDQEPKHSVRGTRQRPRQGKLSPQSPGA